MMDEAEWKKQVKASPGDDALKLAYADWLEERGRDLDAWVIREKAGRCELRYYAVRKESGERVSGYYKRRGDLDNRIGYRTGYDVRVEAVTHQVIGTYPRDEIMGNTWRTALKRLQEASQAKEGPGVI